MAPEKATGSSPANTAGSESVPAASPDVGAQQRAVSVRFEDSSVSYASQFLVNATSEDLVLGFSSGVMDGGDGRPAVLPVQTRIAMSRPAAARLVRLLADALRRADAPGKD